MKNHIRKQTILFAACAMLISTLPVQAEVNAKVELATAPADVQHEVTTKRRFFSGWTQGALQRRMTNAMRELDREWKPFIKCVKEGKKGCFQEAKTIRNLIGTILALVAITGTAAGVRRIVRRPAAGPVTPPSSATPAEEASRIAEEKIPRGVLRRAGEARKAAEEARIAKELDVAGLPPEAR